MRAAKRRCIGLEGRIARKPALQALMAWRCEARLTRKAQACLRTAEWICERTSDDSLFASCVLRAWVGVVLSSQVLDLVHQRNGFAWNSGPIDADTSSYSLRIPKGPQRPLSKLVLEPPFPTVEGQQQAAPLATCIQDEACPEAPSLHAPVISRRSPTTINCDAPLTARSPSRLRSSSAGVLVCPPQSARGPSLSCSDEQTLQRQVANRTSIPSRGCCAPHCPVSRAVSSRSNSGPGNGSSTPVSGTGARGPFSRTRVAGHRSQGTAGSCGAGPSSARKKASTCGSDVQPPLDQLGVAAQAAAAETLLSPSGASTPQCQDSGSAREAPLPRGPERLFYDTRHYTGCARYGGPSVKGGGREGSGASPTITARRWEGDLRGVSKQRSHSISSDGGGSSSEKTAQHVSRRMARNESDPFIGSGEKRARRSVVPSAAGC